jgi:hypothetical protein
MELPGSSAVLEMSLRDLVKWCDRLNLPDNGLTSEEQFRDSLLQHVSQRSRKLSKPNSPLGICKLDSGPQLKYLRQKQETFASLVDAVEAFVYDEHILAWLDKLQLRSRVCWMTPVDFKNAKDICRKTPMILVAGSTSSGKSTLVNALLGENVLPTSYNAATAALCEIKYDDRRHATVYLEDGRKPIHCDLTTDDGCRTFENYVNPVIRDETMSCKRVELFWPVDFLKDVHLVDSPGVTEDEASDGVAREITEQCQKDAACGFIYVLDSTRAAQEAAQAGGLLSAVIKGMKQVPAADSAIFIANKWDLLVQQLSEKDRQTYLHLLSQGLQSRWNGFQRRQLLTLNAKLACTAQQLGESTDDMRRLCIAIKKALPYGMDNAILKSLSGPQTLINDIESIVKSTIHELNLPWKERTQKRGDNMDRLRSFQASLDKGRIGAVQIQLNLEMDSLVRKLSQYLQSGEGKAYGTIRPPSQPGTPPRSNKPPSAQQHSFDKHDMQEMIVHRFCAAITACPEYDKFCKWCNDCIMPDVEKSLEELNMLTANIAGSPNTTVTQQTSAEAGQDSRTRRISTAVAIAVPVLFIGFPLALAVTVVAAPIYGLFRMIGSIKESNFKKLLERHYKETIANACADNCKVLRQVAMGLLKTDCLAVSLVYDTIPANTRKLEHELLARAKQEEKHIPHYRELLHRCQDIKGKIAKFTLEMKIHNNHVDDFGDLDLSSPAAKGSFASVFKVTVHEKETAALKVLNSVITEDNAEEFYREMTSCRRFQHKNLVKFYGSVVMSETPLRLGLLFEWCGGGTVANEIFGSYYAPGFRQEGYRRAQQIASDMLRGVKFLHSQGIIHRDLKPDNLMVTEKGGVKVCDMGLAKPVTQVTGTCCGTMLYIAPELLLQHPCGLSADMFSIGMILWELWHGKRVYMDQKVQRLSLDEFIKEITNGTLRPGGGEFLPGVVSNKETAVELPIDIMSAGREWAKVARRCWSSSPKDRPKADEVYETLKKDS